MLMIDVHVCIGTAFIHKVGRQRWHCELFSSASRAGSALALSI